MAGVCLDKLASSERREAKIIEVLLWEVRWLALVGEPLDYEEMARSCRSWIQSIDPANLSSASTLRPIFISHTDTSGRSCRLGQADHRERLVQHRAARRPRLRAAAPVGGARFDVQPHRGG